MKPDEIRDDRAERAVLGAILADNRSFEDVRNEVALADFHVPAHRFIFDAMLDLNVRGQPIDHVTIAATLGGSGKLANVGGPGYLMGLDQVAPIASNAVAYARIVSRVAVRRRVAQLALDTLRAAAAGETDGAELATRLASEAAAIATGRADVVTLTDVMDQICVELAKVQSGEIRERILPTGIERLDQGITGFIADLIVIGGLPGVGKSALLAALVQSIALSAVKVAVFSLEDRCKWLGWRLLADNSNVENHVLQFRQLTDAQYDRASAALPSVYRYSDNVLIDDRPMLTTGQIVQRTRNLIRNRGVRAVFIDNLSEVRVEHSDRHDLELASSLSELRAMAKGEGVPVVLLAHLNRKADEKPDQPPRLSQFKNASAIEEKARLALGLFRKPDSDVLNVAVLKNTNGKGNGMVIELEWAGTAAMVKACEQQTMQLSPGDAA